MAPRVPLAPAAPVTVAVERDHVEQIRHTGAVGEATFGSGTEAAADLHLVYHPRDLFAYRQAIGRVLLDRAGLAERLPPYLRDGAALWLAGAGGGASSGASGGASGAAGAAGPAGEWYGLPVAAWLAPLAAADVLPTVDELLAGEEPGDGSRLLWTPVAAALIDRLPGDTVAAKLATADLRGRAADLLAQLSAEGKAAGRRYPVRAASADVHGARPTAAVPRRRLPRHAQRPRPRLPGAERRPRARAPATAASAPTRCR